MNFLTSYTKGDAGTPRKPTYINSERLSGLDVFIQLSVKPRVESSEQNFQNSHADVTTNLSMLFQPSVQCCGWMMDMASEPCSFHQHESGVSGGQAA